MLPLGNITLLERPLRPETLLSSVEAALRARQRQFEVRDAILERDNVAEALRVSEEQNRLILQSTQDCIILLGLDGFAVPANHSNERRLDAGHLSITCASLWDALRTREPDAAELACEKARSGGQGQFESCYGTHKSEETWWDVSVTPVRNAGGEIVNLLAVSREITSRKRTERALVQSEKLAAVGRLASSIAHEINNPLEAVTNLLYLARSHATVPVVQEYLAAADVELRRVAVIANQTLRFHKQASNALSIRPSELFATVLSIYEGRLRNAGIHVESGFRFDEPFRCFDGDVRQALNNLVGNAIDTMPAGGRLGLRSHRTTARSSGKSGILLTVADTGTGMPGAVARRAFEPFFTTKASAEPALGFGSVRRLCSGTEALSSSAAAGSEATSLQQSVPAPFFNFSCLTCRERNLKALNRSRYPD